MLNFEEILKDKIIAIIGCGGLGCNIAHLVARLNPKEVIIFDGDTFSESNFNRQLFASVETIGKNKADVAKTKLSLCSNAKITAYPDFFSKDNAEQVINADIILDATDNVASRFFIEKIGRDFHIPIVHGAINGLFGQVALIYPGDETTKKLYPEKKEKTLQKTYSYVPAIVASIQVAEAVKYFANEYPLAPYEVLCIDTHLMEIKKIYI